MLTVGKQFWKVEFWKVEFCKEFCKEEFSELWKLLLLESVIKSASLHVEIAESVRSMGSKSNFVLFVNVELNCAA